MGDGGGGPVCVLWGQVLFRLVLAVGGQNVRGGTPVVEQPALSFAGLLRQLRAEAKLTQEELAEAASLSPRSVSDLERGINRTARKDSALLLADALGLAGPVRELFVAAARGRAPPAGVLATRQGVVPGALAAAARALPGDAAGFAGRVRELGQLRMALEGETRLLLVVGDAGVGKTRFAGEGMRRAAGEGVVCLWGGCLPLAATLPLRPVSEALDALATVDGGRLLEDGLGRVPPYVRAELGRLLPRLGPAALAEAGGGESWQRERLFSAVAELLGAVAHRSAVGLVIDDVHWADSQTLDFLTFLVRAARGDRVTVVATCRGDEAPLDGHVAQWLAHMRGGSGVDELRLGPLSPAEAGEQVAGLVGGAAPERLADELFARAEGNPFFTEQLVAAALAESAGGELCLPAGLPPRLAELLAARVGGCGADAQVVLTALAVAGRPLDEDLLCQVTGLGLPAVRGGLRELAQVRLLAEANGDGAARPRHALLAEAVAARLLPGERITLHERVARALQAIGDESLAAEVAGHWAAAGRAERELPARIAAATAAERVFGYADAAAHWQRAIDLSAAVPEGTALTGVDVPQLYLRAIDALQASGCNERAGELAEEAYRRFAGHPDPAIAAVICWRAGFFRAIEAPDTAAPLFEEALRLFEPAPPSADKARAWFYYATAFLIHDQHGQTATAAALRRALDVAEAVGATGLAASILSWLASDAFHRGLVEEGFAALERGRALAQASGDGAALLSVAMIESDALLKTGRFESATEVAVRGLQTAAQTGRQANWHADFLAANAAEGLLARGRTTEAAALIDPLTAGPPDRDHWITHLCRVEIDLLRGEIPPAVTRQQQVSECAGRSGLTALEVAQPAAELALWAGRPAEALEEVQRVIALIKAPNLAILCGRLLVAGMRACADLAEGARARRDEDAASDAVAAAGALASWVARMSDAPFTGHPFVAAIPAEHATWVAERTRLAGSSDPAAWSAAAKAWDGLGCPHRAAYAWWRLAEALLMTGQQRLATAALHAATGAADGHAPLLAQIRTLAERAHIPLQPRPEPSTGTRPPQQVLASYGLTGRELAVVRLLAAGRTNAQIGAELYISPKTASVHVTSILRKFGVASRVQAAAVAERAGLLHDHHHH